MESRPAHEWRRGGIPVPKKPKKDDRWEKSKKEKGDH
jgi:hypothetical protein